MNPVALVAGASWGIGRCTCEQLASRGYRTFGTSRNPTNSPGSSIEMLEMEAGSDASVRRCVEQVLNRAHRIDALIYSIGDGIAGAVEEVESSEAAPVFEANFWGAVRMTQAVLPTMRKQQQGRIVFMSSIGGVIGIPFRGLYVASKFALEGFAEALRYEAAPFGIEVSIIEPPGVRTPAVGRVRQASRKLSDYQQLEAPFTARFDDSMRNGMPPEQVAHAILRVLSARHPRLRVPVGFKARSLSILRRAMPQRSFEFALRRALLQG